MTRIGIRRKCLLPFVSKSLELTDEAKIFSLFFWKRIDDKHVMRAHPHASGLPLAAAPIDYGLEQPRLMLAILFFHHLTPEILRMFSVRLDF